MCNEANYFCRVCGLDQEESPWGDDEKTPSFGICACCGVEFGYEDRLLESIRRYRNQWIQAGSKWSDPQDRPFNWELEKQLKQIRNLYV